MTKNSQRGNNVVTPLTYKKPVLAAIGIFSAILIAILIIFREDARTLSIIGHICGILCFIALVVVVGVILPTYLQKKTDNPLHGTKQCLMRFAKLKGLGWVKEDRSIEFLLLWIGVTLGFWGLIFGLVVTLSIPS
jgi:hypothetical protein